MLAAGRNDRPPRPALQQQPGKQLPSSQPPSQHVDEDITTTSFLSHQQQASIWSVPGSAAAFASDPQQPSDDADIRAESPSTL